MLEFVVEKGLFYLVHASVANRSSLAAVKIAVDMVKSKLITEEEAIMRLDPFHLHRAVEAVVNLQFGMHLMISLCV